MNMDEILSDVKTEGERFNKRLASYEAQTEPIKKQQALSALRRATLDYRAALAKLTRHQSNV